ncbi:hypothetical protein RJ640_025136 [Escallonia rubra]|uniref:Uncharacterized protein n=1 Tax=Escallonia rubra TaxID=112253 RepID=A0AA88S4N0_9ASTE|nr:hypothetical protein RJ640_025136 [Escallonia rubra]
MKGTPTPVSGSGSSAQRANLLDNNQFLDSISAELNVLKMLSEVQVDEKQLISASFGASCKGRSDSW